MIEYINQTMNFLVIRASVYFYHSSTLIGWALVIFGRQLLAVSVNVGIPQ
jgi:hypothetical protein